MIELTDLASREELEALGITGKGNVTIADAISYAFPEPAATERQTQEVIAEIQDLFDAAKVDINMLAAICVPHVFKYQYPPVFVAAWAWVLQHIHQERTFPKLALGLPRGFGKTLVIKLLILYAILYTKKQYILVFGAREEQAINIIRDVATALDSDTVKTVYGDWAAAKEKDVQDLKIFHFRGRAITLQAAGAGTAIRGTNINDVRPDLIIFDDIQKRESADSEIETKTLKDWFQGTALKLRSPFGCLYLFLANMYPTPHSMLRWLKDDSNWMKFITGAILADGSSLWPELYPIEQLLDEYNADCSAGRRDIFMSEIMNDENASVNTKLQVELLKPRNPEPGLPHQGCYVIIDPARGTVGLDAVAIGYYEIHNDRPILLDLDVGSFSPGDQVRNAIKMCMKHQCNLVCVEAVAYQETLLYWCNLICEMLGISGIFFEPIYPTGGSKNQRILNVFKEWAADEVAVSTLCWNQVMNQALQFNPLSTKNKDDILDLLVYGPIVASKFADFLATQSVMAIQLSDTNPLLQMADSELSPF